MTRYQIHRGRPLHLIFLLSLCAVGVGQASPHLGQGIASTPLTEVVFDGDGVRDRQVSIELPGDLDEPLLVVYVPATRSAKRCVMNLVEPIEDAGAALLPINLVNVLDLTQANVLIRWLVKTVYRGAREENADPRVRFFFDSTGVVRTRWGIAQPLCAYTLYHPNFLPLSGSGMPTERFIRAMLDRLTVAN